MAVAKRLSKRGDAAGDSAILGEEPGGASGADAGGEGGSLLMQEGSFQSVGVTVRKVVLHSESIDRKFSRRTTLWHGQEINSSAETSPR